MSSQAETAKATLEIDIGAETVSGVITGEDGVERRFSGWMEFASVIEGWRAEHRPGAAEGPAVAGERDPRSSPAE